MEIFRTIIESCPYGSTYGTSILTAEIALLCYVGYYVVREIAKKIRKGSWRKALRKKISVITKVIIKILFS